MQLFPGLIGLSFMTLFVSFVEQYKHYWEKIGDG